MFNDLSCRFRVQEGIAIAWKIDKEKSSRSKKGIERELSVSRSLVEDKNIGQEYWERLEGKNYAAKKIDDRAFRTLEKLCPSIKGKKVLVVGCGGGKDIEWILSKGAKEVVGTDISLDLLRVSKKRFSSKKRRPSYYFLANAEDLPVKKDSFDMVLFGSALHHVPNYKKALASACKIAPVVMAVAEPSSMGILGRLLSCFDWCTEYGGLPTHRFKKKDLEKQLVRLGFEAKIRTNFVWFPLKLLKAVANNRSFVNYYFFLLSVADVFLGRWGHNLTLVAIRKDVHKKLL